MNHLRNAKKRVLILGGYGTFGSRIGTLLSDQPNIQIIIAGRDKVKADLAASKLNTHAEGLRLDYHAINLAAQLKTLHLDLLIHCAGPFQQQGYQVASACIEAGISYIDIADARRFVCEISQLNTAAENAGVTVISGASSLPALSSAVLGEFCGNFSRIDSADIAITPAHRIVRGLATVRAGFESLGKDFNRLSDGQQLQTYCGENLRRIRLAHPVGERFVSDFDVPDLELWPKAIKQLENVQFGTGVQPRILQFGLSLCARLARIHPATTSQTMPWFARLGHKLAALWPGGCEHGGMKVQLTGTDKNGLLLGYSWQILGLNGDGPWIPAAPAAALAKKILSGNTIEAGARPCWQLLTLDEILQELSPFSIVTSLEKLPEQEALSASAVSN